MRLRPISILAVCLLLFSCDSGIAQTNPSVSEGVKKSELRPLGKGSLWLIPHTHWEGAVFKTRAEYLEVGLPNTLKALNMLKKYPEYRFVLDQVAYVKPFLERYPEEEPAFRKFVAEGRLQLVGGMDIMPDVNMPGGELFVRQVQYGKGYYREKLGVDVTVGWLLDTFGHHAQMPQILKLAGFNSYWFFRGVPNLDVPSEFLWQGIDGTKIPAFWLPYGYSHFYGSPRNLTEFTDFFKERFNLLTRFARGTDRVGLDGADISEPEEHVARMVEEFNQSSDVPFSIRFAVPTDFEAVAAKRADRPIIKGEFNPLFQGVYSSRIEVKQWYRSLERLLTTAEKLSALSRWLGLKLDDGSINRAWEPVLFNVTHDLASGVMVDKVYEDALAGYLFSKRLGDEVVEENLARIFSQIDTTGDGIPIVVFNTLGWPRTDIAEVAVGFSEAGVFNFDFVDHTGQAVPVQPLESEKYGDGGLKQVKIAFVARDVPAMGYATYHVIPKQSASDSKRASESS